METITFKLPNKLFQMYLTPQSTSRLLIRPLTTDDIPAWEEFFDNNDGLRFFNFDENLSGEVKAQNWIKKQFWRYENILFGLYALTDKNTGILLGQCGLLLQEVDGKKETEIGYHVLPKYWGNGFATEAAQFFKKYAFENNISDTLISIIDVDNFRSQKVAEKNGMLRTIKTEFQKDQVFIYRINKPVKH